MGNRAVITASKKSDAVAIYLHWNGGPESVLAFLHAAKELGMRDPTQDAAYGMARLIQVIGNFLGTTDTGMGVSTLACSDVDNYDNGAYLIGPSFTIAERWGEGSDKSVMAYADLTQADKAKHDAIVKEIVDKMTPSPDPSRAINALKAIIGNKPDTCGYIAARNALEDDIRNEAIAAIKEYEQ